MFGVSNQFFGLTVPAHRSIVPVDIGISSRSTPKSLVSLVSNEKRLINGGFLKLVSIYGVLSISDFGFPMVPHGSINGTDFRSRWIAAKPLAMRRCGCRACRVRRELLSCCSFIQMGMGQYL